MATGYNSVAFHNHESTEPTGAGLAANSGASDTQRHRAPAARRGHTIVHDEPLPHRMRPADSVHHAIELEAEEIQQEFTDDQADEETAHVGIGFLVAVAADCVFE